MYHEANPIKIKTRIRMPSTGMESSKDSKSACGLNGKKLTERKQVFFKLLFCYETPDNSQRRESYINSIERIHHK